MSVCPEKALDSRTLGRTEHWGHTQNVATDPFGDPPLPLLFFLLMLSLSNLLRLTV